MNDRHQGRGGQQHKKGTQGDMLSLFYFANTYPEDNVKARNMQKNVEYDLKPFMAYLTASIEQAGRSTSIGAEVHRVEGKREKKLVPKFSLIKLLSQEAAFEIEKPQDIYFLEVDDDMEFDTNSFEVRSRSGVICTYEDKIGVYDGKIAIKLTGFGKTQGNRHNLYDNEKHNEDSIKCTISAVDYGSLDVSWLEGFGSQVKSVEDREGRLIIQVDKIPSGLKKVSLFGEDLAVLKTKSPQVINLSAKGHSIVPQGEFYLVTPEIKDKQKVYSGDKPIKYEKIDLCQWTTEKILEFFQTSSLSVSNGGLVYTGEEDDEVTFLDKCRFDIITETVQRKNRFKDKHGKSIGTIIEVVTDSNSISDLESNVDVFFKESTESLTDRLPFKGGTSREFKVGWKDENRGFLEIAEKTKGCLKKIDDLPERLYAVPNDWQLKRQKEAIFKLQENLAGNSVCCWSCSREKVKEGRRGLRGRLFLQRRFNTGTSLQMMPMMDAPNSGNLFRRLWLQGTLAFLTVRPVVEKPQYCWN